MKAEKEVLIYEALMLFSLLFLGLHGASEESAGRRLCHVRRARGTLRKPRRAVLCKLLLLNCMVRDLILVGLLQTYQKQGVRAS